MCTRTYVVERGLNIVRCAAGGAEEEPQAVSVRRLLRGFGGRRPPAGELGGRGPLLHTRTNQNTTLLKEHIRTPSAALLAKESQTALARQNDPPRDAKRREYHLSEAASVFHLS